MRPEARDQFLANANAVAEGLGGSSFQEGIAMTRKALAYLTQLLDSVQTPELLAKGLDELQLSPELENLLVQGVAAAPLILRWFAKDFNDTAQVTLPTLPNRRPAVPAKNQVEILQFINDLSFQHGVPLEDAKRRAARRFGCGPRTVERYWRQRKEILEKGPKYQFNELVEALRVACIESIAAERAERSLGNGTAQTNAGPQAVPDAIR
jgi:hypothetical protein